jgi:hypothetical protein
MTKTKERASDAVYHWFVSGLDLLYHTTAESYKILVDESIEQWKVWKQVPVVCVRVLDMRTEVDQWRCGGY